LVDATQPNTPFLNNLLKMEIVLNIAPHAVHQFHMSNDAITFSARFGGVLVIFMSLFLLLLGFMHVKMDKVYSSIQANMPMCKRQKML
jgi:stringent starvation protein B